jgi:hypothetical protein
MINLLKWWSTIFVLYVVCLTLMWPYYNVCKFNLLNMYAEQPEYTPLMVSEAVLLLTNDEVEDGDINVDNVAEGVGGEVEGKDINVDNVADVVGEGLGGDGFFDDEYANLTED